MPSRTSCWFASLAAVVLVAACGESITQSVPPPPPPGSYTLALSSPTLSVVQGGKTTVNVTLARTAFAGPVTLGVDIGDFNGTLPPGVAPAWAPNPVTDNSSVLTLMVDAAAVPGVYDLVVYGDETPAGNWGLANLTLTVKGPQPTPGYTLALSASTLSIAQSAWSSITTVHLVRTNFTGSVELSVENLPTGVRAYFNYPPTGDPSVMSLFVPGNALPGTYSNLLVRGVASGLPDRTAPLTLTITVAPFVLAVSPTLSIAQGAATTTTVNVVRNNFTGPVALYAYGDMDEHFSLPPGITTALSPDVVTGDSSVLTITVASATLPGVYDIVVHGLASTAWYETFLTLTVTPRSP